MAETTRWEYRVHTFGGVLRGAKDEDLQAALDEWGEEGWEVISAIAPDNSSAVKVIAKRPQTAAYRRRRSMPI
jgi:hypothetical protein